jgi:hypothetical protein
VSGLAFSSPLWQVKKFPASSEVMASSENGLKVKKNT